MQHFMDPQSVALIGISRKSGPGSFNLMEIMSEFVREIKVGFARYYNRRHNRRGYFWGDRFKSVTVDKGETLINCLAYIEIRER